MTATPAPVLARRLSNAEYNYTIHDLTGVDIRPAREFPVDPANLAGFDNSGESLTMSPALLTKYLQAARLVADHMFLNPNGFEFAPHPMLVETDREKFCIQQIVDFYDRQTDRLLRLLPRGLDLQASVGVRQAQGDARRHRRAEQGERAVPDDHLAGARRTKEDVGPLAKLQTMWRALPVPEKGSDPLPRSVHTDARFRRAHAQGHVAEVREPGREGLERRVATADELEEPAVRHAPPRFRARGAARRR